MNCLVSCSFLSIGLNIVLKQANKFEKWHLHANLYPEHAGIKEYGMPIHSDLVFQDHTRHMFMPCNFTLFEFIPAGFKALAPNSSPLKGTVFAWIFQQ